MLTRELYAYYMHNSNVSSNYVRLFVNHLCERKHQRVLKGLVHSEKLVLKTPPGYSIATAFGRATKANLPIRPNGVMALGPGSPFIAALVFTFAHRIALKASGHKSQKMPKRGLRQWYF